MGRSSSSRASLSSTTTATTYILIKQMDKYLLGSAQNGTTTLLNSTNEKKKENKRQRTSTIAMATTTSTSTMSRNVYNNYIVQFIHFAAFSFSLSLSLSLSSHRMSECWLALPSGRYKRAKALAVWGICFGMTIMPLHNIASSSSFSIRCCFSFTSSSHSFFVFLFPESEI